MTTFLTPDPITVEVRNAAGEVHVELGDSTTTEVEVTASGGHPLGFLDDVFRQFRGRNWDVESLRRQFSFSGGPGGRTSAGSPQDAASPPDEDPVERVRIDLKTPADRPATLIVDTDPARSGWSSAFTVRISAPTGSSLRVQSQSADVQLTGEAAKVEIRTASGDVEVEHATDKVLLHSASGDVRLRAAGSSCDVQTASGDITVERAGADALLHTTSGDIRVEAPAGDVSARSVSGDVQLVDVVSGRTEVNTVSGDVEVGIHAGTLASVELSTTSGETDTDFPVNEAPPSDTAPVLHLKVTTTSGQIRLRRAVSV